MRRLSLALASLSMLAPAAAHADVHWLCGLSMDTTRLVCLADVDAVLTVAASEPTPATAVVNGTRFPLDARRLYTVDFWSPATDLAFVERLAQATLCYRSPGCQVTVTAPSERTALRSTPAEGVLVSR